ncbi:MAG: hypothetical protein ACLGRW_07370 [Acidobacteriota bacterium]
MTADFYFIAVTAIFTIAACLRQHGCCRIFNTVCRKNDEATAPRFPGPIKRSGKCGRGLAFLDALRAAKDASGGGDSTNAYAEPVLNWEAIESTEDFAMISPRVAHEGADVCHA